MDLAMLAGRTAGTVLAPNLEFDARQRLADRRDTAADQRIVGGKGGAMRSEEHTSELQSLMRISYAVFCLKKKNTQLYSHQYSVLKPLIFSTHTLSTKNTQPRFTL